MMSLVKLSVLLFVYLSTVIARQDQTHYSNEFAVHIPNGKEAADEIATRHGFVNVGQVRDLFYMIL